MNIRYTVNFYVDEEDGKCSIVIPALEYVIIPDIKEKTPASLIKYARREMEEIAAVILQDSGDLPPDDESLADNRCTFSTIVEGNTDEGSKRIKVIKEFDFS